MISLVHWLAFICPFYLRSAYLSVDDLCAVVLSYSSSLRALYDMEFQTSELAFLDSSHFKVFGFPAAIHQSASLEQPKIPRGDLYADSGRRVASTETLVVISRFTDDRTIAAAVLV
ncbi:hypothetical protein HN011_001075 [Eciton burchellii]|nr:hypothetical protein HN011_001075 [Eciton burchellii]